MERLKPLFTLKNTCVVLLLMNIASIVLGISYLAIQSYNIIWDLFGIILLGSLFGNIILIHNTWKKINNNSKIGNRINLLFYGYLVFSVFAMPLMFLCNFLISNSYSNEISDNIVMVSIVYISYFGLLLIGIGIIYLILSNIENIGLWSSENKTEREEKSKTRIVKKILRMILEFFTYIGIIGSVIFAYVTVNGIYGGFIFGIFVAMMGIFFGFVFLSTTVLLLKLTNLRKKKNLFKSLALVGFFSSLICMFPYFSSPLYIYDAELNFSEAFGENWRDNINASADIYFMKTQFSLPGYFLGIQGPNCIIEKDIEFYNETSGPNAGFKLHFDAYMPLNNGKDSSGNWLPGHNSTIIRVHGGAWVLGDKGAGNMMQMNKYLAAQGYIVFDIQYGLYNGSFTIPIITPEYKLGNFTMNEIVNHTGEFTKYLGIHADEYGANLDSVFISGGSAGGQLTLAMALGIHNGTYSDIFGGGLTIKGIVPFYPANQENCESFFLPGESRCEFLDPGLLVEIGAPPCLIFQGTQDNLIERANSFKSTYDEKGNDCAIIYMPFAGHANDLYYSGYYNQVFLYYMERFLYIYR